ncbi:hypothetical protein E3E35_07925 [Thermococcus sp. GR7]|uniref:hypothetical protein n=1 Tax=unclassified Thermococcus TaxID=2627626 RepID=UPI00142F585D|nr:MULTISPECIES: hypothetical protein [unclassified Thermococcus]NJE47326.1 hypothetical protein [Thermococcus sp. GR7]NJF23184.1 hypothetical protein [Thermococcus sp. GR5]
MGKVVTGILVGLLVVSIFLNVVVYQAADDEISLLKDKLSAYGGVILGNDSLKIAVDYYDYNPVVLEEVLISGHTLTIEPGHIRYTCFNYVVPDTRLTIEAKKLDKTPVNYYLFDYELYFKDKAHAIIFGGTFTGDNQTYYLNRFSAMEVGRTYCVGFSVPTKIYTTEGEKDVATNAKVWAKVVVEAHVDPYPEEVMDKK